MCNYRLLLHIELPREDVSKKRPENKRKKLSNLSLFLSFFPDISPVLSCPPRKRPQPTKTLKVDSKTN